MEDIFYAGNSIKVINAEFGVKKLILNRPDIRNAFNEEMINEIIYVLKELKDIKNIYEMRLLTIEGTGKVFCAGADLNYMRSLADKSHEENLLDAKNLAKMFYEIVNFPTPVISFVHGAAIGGGFGLVACSDYVLTTEETVLATSEVLLGIVPGVISPYIIRKIGVAFASPILLSGKKQSADECLKIGLIHKVTKKENIENEKQEILQHFLQAAPSAARITKELIKNSYPLPNQVQIDFTIEKIAVARSSSEGKAGLTAFFEKKNPSWCDGMQK
ncbi:enoyl-CoA hydratase-related protein [Pigmentibacter sp. JX0631]|uniref:enoyl-CoA hydratase-related protein n=1 Tax=Pigmentibacter sp. JX0631 TaxID=2976982 RepID=UPI0024687EE7|nr:enoyl-CoA hydratase-related protein [Pigmentibacter sp. JX0631]WGL59697.1 enoyl-CoA hydratase-related protein [Pigmentibacter sp. JX0631]